MEFRVGDRPYTTTDAEMILKADLYGFSGTAEYMAIRKIVEEDMERWKGEGSDGKESKHDR